jgi:hypothetical protein
MAFLERKRGLPQKTMKKVSIRKARNSDQHLPVIYNENVEDSKQRAMCEDLLYICIRVRQTIY